MRRPHMACIATGLLLVGLGCARAQAADIDVWLQYVGRIQSRSPLGQVLNAFGGESRGDRGVDLWTVRVCNNTSDYQVLSRPRVLSQAPFTDLPDHLAEDVLVHGKPVNKLLWKIERLLLTVLHPGKPVCACPHFGTFLPARFILEPAGCGATDWIIVSPPVPDAKSIHYGLAL